MTRAHLCNNQCPVPLISSCLKDEVMGLSNFSILSQMAVQVSWSQKVYDAPTTTRQIFLHFDDRGSETMVLYVNQILAQVLFT